MNFHYTPRGIKLYQKTNPGTPAVKVPVSIHDEDDMQVIAKDIAITPALRYLSAVAWNESYGKVHENDLLHKTSHNTLKHHPHTPLKADDALRPLFKRKLMCEMSRETLLYNPATGQMESVLCAESMHRKYPLPGFYHTLGGVMDLLRLRRDTVECLEAGHRRFSRFAYTKLAHFNIFRVAHPDLVREIFVKKHKQFKRPNRQSHVISVFDKGGILSVEDDEWKRQRQGTNEHFSRPRINSQMNMIADLARMHVSEWKKGSVFDVRKATGAFAFDVLHHLLLGGQFGDGSKDLRKAMEDMQSNMLRDLLAYAPLPASISTFFNPKWRRAQTYFKDYITTKIDEYRDNPPENPDLLAAMIANIEHYEGNEEEKTRKLCDELFQILFAGHETFANASAWGIHIMARNPEILERINAEVEAVCGDSPVTMDHIEKLDYTSRVFMEVIRLYPPIYGNIRQAQEDTTLGGHPVPKGAYVGVPVLTLQRDPEYFPEPLKFDPDRFLPENIDSFPREAYIPWGAGGHRCMGQNMATLEGIALFAEVARQMQMAPLPGLEAMPKEHGLITLSPEPGSCIAVAPRHQTGYEIPHGLYSGNKKPETPPSKPPRGCPFHRK